MSWILASRVIIQGITEPNVDYYISQMKTSQTNIVAGVSSGQGGKSIEEIPVFDLVDNAISEVGKVDASLIFVPPYQVLDAAREAISVGIKQIIILTSQVPPLDTISLLRHAADNDAIILGPGSDGLIIPNQVCLGILNPKFYQLGTIGLVSSSKYLSYEVAWSLNQASMGQSIVVDLGNDAILGSELLQWLPILNKDRNTEAIVYIGQELHETEALANYYRNYGYNKPLILYLVGLQSPQDKIFRDTTTIISNHLSASIPTDNREQKNLAELNKAGIKIVKKISQIPDMLQKVLSKSA